MQCIHCGFKNTEDVQVCDVCGKKLKQRPMENQDERPKKSGRLTTGLIVGGVVGVFVIALIVGILLILNVNPTAHVLRTWDFEYDTVYVCTNAPNTMTQVNNVMTTTRIYGFEDELLLWQEETSFNREAYVAHYWHGGTVRDRDIRSWFTGPNNVMNFPHTYWELISVNSQTVVTRFSYVYLHMSNEEARELWHGDDVPGFAAVYTHLVFAGASCEQY